MRSTRQAELIQMKEVELPSYDVTRDRQYEANTVKIEKQSHYKVESKKGTISSLTHTLTKSLTKSLKPGFIEKPDHC